METTELINIYMDYQKRIEDLWRSLWPRYKRKTNKKTRRRN